MQNDEEVVYSMKDYLKKTPLVTYTSYLIGLLEGEICKFLYPVNVIKRKEILSDIKNAVESNRGYAMGKIGISEQHLMYYKIMLEKEKKIKKRRKFQKRMIFECFNNSGIFPPDLNFFLKYNDFYIPHVKNLDCLGIFYFLHD